MANKTYITVVGLGYVGLPLAIEFSKKFETIGFDINEVRLKELSGGYDSTDEVPKEVLETSNIKFTSHIKQIAKSNFYVVTVPTPIDEYNKPDLRPLEEASRIVGTVLKKGDYVIFESTVFPGATEEICVPILEKHSSLIFNKDFFAGYSPERINPGDKEHTVRDILKITSGSTPKASEYIDSIYKRIIEAGTYRASSIKVAEAAKVIENTQRDVNIGLINEFTKIFDLLNIDTEEVLEAAESKWNFLSFRPGLVGGHCIGVDPFYLTHKAQSLGFDPEIILAGRRTNDNMAHFVVEKLIKKMKSEKIQQDGSKCLVMGLTFKENCPDIRNTKVVDLIEALQDKGIKVDCYDPYVDTKLSLKEYGLNMLSKPVKGSYDTVILAVQHDTFFEMGIDDIKKFTKDESIIFDLKYMFDKDETEMRL